MSDNRRVLQLSEVEKAYAAGLVDGEGSVMVTRRPARYEGQGYRYSFRSHVAVVNGYRPLLEWLQERWGGSIKDKHSRFGTKTLYNWSLSHQLANAFVRDIAPYVVLKRESVDIALEFALLPRASAKMTEEEYQLRLTLYERHRALGLARGTRQGRLPAPRAWQTEPSVL